MNSFRPLSPTSATCGTNPERPRRAPAVRGLMLVAAALVAVAAANARTLEAVQARGAVTLCAHANAMPFSSRREEPPGFQIELARALARHLGVELAVAWVVTPNQYRTAECDIVLDTIVDEDVLAQTRLRASRPYQRSGVAIALPANASEARSFDDLERGRPIGVQVESVAQMVLSQRGLTDGSVRLRGGYRRGGECRPDRRRRGVCRDGRLLQHEASKRAHPTGSRLRARARPLMESRRRHARFRRSPSAEDRCRNRRHAFGRTIRAIYARYGIEHRPPATP